MRVSRRLQGGRPIELVPERLWGGKGVPQRALGWWLCRWSWATVLSGTLSRTVGVRGGQRTDVTAEERRAQCSPEEGASEPEEWDGAHMTTVPRSSKEEPEDGRSQRPQSLAELPGGHHE